MSSQQYKTSLDNHNADNYNTHANFVYSAKYTSPIFDLLNAQPGEKIIDLGCGTGELTEIIRKTVGDSGEVWAVDSSEDMLIKARQSPGNAGVTFLQGDIQSLSSSLDASLEGKFDAVFSSATFHWCKANPGGVVDSVKWLLKPGGRIAFELGGFGNCAGLRGPIHHVLRGRNIDPIPLDPWYFPTDVQYCSLLKGHGMIPGEVKLVPRPSPLPTSLAGWLKTFARNTFFAGFDDDQADKLIEEVVDICRPEAYWSNANPAMGVKPEGEEGEHGWEVMYVRLRGIAYAPA